MIKKLLLLALCQLMTLHLMAYHFEHNGVYYSYGYGDDECWVDRNPDDPYAGKITIPSTVTYEGKTLRVVSILGSAFYGCEHLTAITLTPGLETINAQAFMGCTALKSVVVPEGVRILGGYCFADCTALETASLPGSLGEKLYTNTFSGCSSLKEVSLGEGITCLPNNMFQNCSSLSSVNIPSTVEVMYDYAFENCTALESLTLPAGLKQCGKIGNSPLLTTLELPAGLEYFGGCPGTGVTRMHLPAGITKLPEFCFSACTKLTTVTAESPLTSIGGGAFGGCESLESLPSLTDVTEVGISAFWCCKKLRSLLFSDKLNTISLPCSFVSGTMNGCESLETVNLGNNVKEIPIACFQGCTSLKEFNAPAKCTKIQCFAFEGCKSLRSVTLPERMESFGGNGGEDFYHKGYVFSQCYALESIRIPEGIDTLWYATLNNCKSLKEVQLPSKLRVIDCYGLTNCPLTKLDLPASLRRIDYQAIECPNLEELVIPAGVTHLGSEENRAWMSCENLKRLIFEDSPKALEHFEPMHCDNLEYLYIGRDLTTAEEWADQNIGFSWYELKELRIGDHVTDLRILYPNNCINLTNITCSAINPPLIKKFNPNTYQSVSPLIDSRALEAYQQADGWKGFFSFTTQDDLNGIEDVLASDSAGTRTEVYDLRGTRISGNLKSLPKGVYILRQGGKSRKISL